MSKSLVIVESPTKAKTLRGFLGAGYLVESSVGHVRDLPARASEIPTELKKTPWARIGVNVDADFEPLYVVQPEKRKTIAHLKKLAGTVDELLLATDEDREGEAISWHLVEVLRPKVPVKRMVFHEITRAAILDSLEHTREIDENLVSAQETRRIIDRLYGYEVSPILWRKVAPKLSAGRVQSVSVRLLVEREEARRRFRPAWYWDLVAVFRDAEQRTFAARLLSLDGKRLAGGKDFDPDTGKLNRNEIVHLSESDARALHTALRSARFDVVSVEEKPFARSPSPPFSTSTLQQEANRKLRFDAKRTMRAAQQLYENGFITYMRTDSVILSAEALAMIRAQVANSYGKEFLPSEPRVYKSKVKNAQEAHEAIRPAGERIATVDEVHARLGDDCGRVYELVWTRTLASQMTDARGRRLVVQVEGKADGRAALFQAVGSTIDFPGFLRAYVEGSDDPEAALAERDTILPPVREGDVVEAQDLSVEEHVTSPPARLTEASLVKLLEELGIGRPSTYATILDTILRRGYTFRKGTALVPTFVAFAVVRLMKEHLAGLVDVDFTARMEDRLDEISRGERKALPYLREFYFGNGYPGLHATVERKGEEIDAREACTIAIGENGTGAAIVVRVGRYGPYLQRGDSTAPIPEGLCPDELTVAKAEELLLHSQRADEPLGKHPESGLPVYARNGRFGPYVQLGDADPADKKKRPKTSSLLPSMSLDTLTLEQALQLLSLPRTLGADDAGQEIVAHNGRFGPYIRRGDDTRSLAPSDNVLTVGRERALELLAQEKRGRSFRRAATALRVFPQVAALEGREVRILDGRYGPYATDGTVNASLPRGADPMAVSEEDVVALILAKRDAPGRPARRGRGKATAKGGAKAAAKSAAKGRAKGRAKSSSRAKKAKAAAGAPAPARTKAPGKASPRAPRVAP
ncbi:MAG: type I DNA topoisomerase [bacterium]